MSLRHPSSHRRLSAEEAVKRAVADFEEMPDLRVTCAQAMRLWSIDVILAREALEGLAASGYLRTDRGSYWRVRA